ncbi:MAG: phytanoyl-CoA dioxygenase [Pseudomonadales bacterium]|nr:phytanoyl-CoA dioxygenase [Pseudomonadales bacterium]
MASPLSAKKHNEAMREYVGAGTDRAHSLGNRGPIRFDANGKLAQDILDAYWEHGFYVFEGLVAENEISLLRHDYDYILDRAPVDNSADIDLYGRPALGIDFARRPYSMIKPLSDPWGGTELLGGRHQTQMDQPTPATDAPKKVPFLIGSMCQLSDAALRLYGHADILTVAEGINGPDFVPFNDATFVKQAGLGGSVAWHQDGLTHWNSPQWDEGIHGFNFQVQLYECTPYNCLWVMPGTHKLGKIDIKQRVADNGGSERLPGAVPLLCNPGDVTIANRQVLHCSFANSSPNIRISVTFGFHRLTSVLGARGVLGQESEVVYDEERVDARSSVIQVAIDARANFYPDEKRYTYAPFAGRESEYRFCPEVVEHVLKDYTLNDLSI